MEFRLKKITLILFAVLLLAVVSFAISKRAKADAVPVAAAPLIALSNATDTATLYAQLSILSTKQRKAFYKQRSGQEKAKLWTLHFTAYALDHNLTPGQASVIKEMLDAIKGADFDKDKGAFAYRFDSQKQRMVELFGKAGAWELVQNLGGESPFDAQPVRFFKTNAYDGDSCSCAPGDDWCGSGSVCGCAQSCKNTNAGCGWFWLTACDGLCHGVECPPPLEQ